MTRRVLVCGGREFNERERLFRELDRLHAEDPFSIVIHGAARGADRLADQWAEARGIPRDPYKPNYAALGPKRAPIVRNVEMLRDGKPDLVVAFPGGNGTAHMKNVARAANVPVEEIE